VAYTAFGEILDGSGSPGGDAPQGFPRYEYAGAWGYETAGFDDDPGGSTGRSHLLALYGVKTARMLTGENDMTAANNDNLKAALDYARRGLPVLPCHSIRDGKCSCCDRPGLPSLPTDKCDRPGKHPWTKNGFKNATTDADQIRSWWRTYPDANIGIATGRASGIIVIDCDVKDGRDGRETLYGLTKQYRALPDTPSTVTGSSTEHFLFRHPAGIAKVPSRAGVAPGIDVRGDAGYIIVPPSLHQSGGRYRWKPGHTLDDHDPPSPSERTKRRRWTNCRIYHRTPRAPSRNRQRARATPRRLDIALPYRLAYLTPAHLVASQRIRVAPKAARSSAIGVAKGAT